jgi:methylmalonyl-CoA/ethylmalonyl-CoA epimerase
MGPETPVGKFLAKRGPGIHHICYAVPDLRAAIAACKQSGLEMIDEIPRIGAKGNQLAFIHPKATGGVLLELCESKTR